MSAAKLAVLSARASVKPASADFVVSLIDRLPVAVLFTFAARKRRLTTTRNRATADASACILSTDCTHDDFVSIEGQREGGRDGHADDDWKAENEAGARRRRADCLRAAADGDRQSRAATRQSA